MFLIIYLPQRLIMTIYKSANFDNVVPVVHKVRNNYVCGFKS